MWLQWLLLQVVLLFVLFGETYTAKILLGYAPQSLSHLRSMLPLADQLARACHKVTVIHTIKKPDGTKFQPNITAIPITIQLQHDYENQFANQIWKANFHGFSMFFPNMTLGTLSHNLILDHADKLCDLLNQKWDLVLADVMFNAHMYGIAEQLQRHYGTPFTSMATTSVLFPDIFRLGISDSLATTPCMFGDGPLDHTDAYIVSSFANRFVTSVEKLMELTASVAVEAYFHFEMHHRCSQLLIPWIELLFLMNIYVKIFTLAQQQQQQSMNGNMAVPSPNQPISRSDHSSQQPSFEDLNKSFQNLLMHHYHPPHHHIVGTGGGGGSAPGGVPLFHHPLTLDALRTLHNHPFVLPAHQAFGGHLLPSAEASSPIDGGRSMSGPQTMVTMKIPSVGQSLQQPALHSQQQTLQQLPQQPSSPTQPQQQLPQVSQQHPHGQSQISGQFTQEAPLQSRSAFAAPTSYASGDQQRRFPTVLSAGLLPLFAPTPQQTSFAAAPLPSLPVQPFIPTTTATVSQEQPASTTATESLHSSNSQVPHYSTIANSVVSGTSSTTSEIILNQRIRTAITGVAPIPNGSTILMKLSPPSFMMITSTTPFTNTTPSYSLSTFSTDQLLTTDINVANTLSTVSTTGATKSLAKDEVVKDSTKMYKAAVTRPPSAFAISPKNEFDSVDSEQQHLNLTRHLNDNSDLENFLQTTNLSIQDAHTFLKLVEQVLEEEVLKRVQERQSFSTTNASVAKELYPLPTNMQSEAESGNSGRVAQLPEYYSHSVISLAIPPDDINRDSKIVALVNPSPHLQHPNRSNYKESNNAAEKIKQKGGDTSLYEIVDGIPLSKVVSAAVVESLTIPPPDDISDLVPLENHQLKTVNTRLAYQNAAVVNETSDLGRSSIGGGALSPLNYLPPQQPHHQSYDSSFSNHSHRLGGSTASGIPTLPLSNAADTKLSASIIPPESILLKESSADYRQQEQADFDRLLTRFGNNGGIVEKSTADDDLLSSAAAVDISLSSSDSGLIASQRLSGSPKPVNDDKSYGGLSSAGFVAGSPNNAGGILTSTIANPLTTLLSGISRSRAFNRHGHQTTFEKLFEDYRYRLSGSENGLNDIVKALRNAHIGFFERRIRGGRL